MVVGSGLGWDLDFYRLRVDDVSSSRYIFDGLIILLIDKGKRHVTHFSALSSTVVSQFRVKTPQIYKLP